MIAGWFNGVRRQAEERPRQTPHSRIERKSIGFGDTSQTRDGMGRFDAGSFAKAFRRQDARGDAKAMEPLIAG